MRRYAALLMLLTGTAYGASEEDCLALNIYHEARNQTYMGQFAVGLVTLNRVKSSRWPKTVCKVVWQPKQFSWTEIKKGDYKPKNPEAWKKAKWVARMLMTKNVNDITKGAVYYHADYVDPYWSDAYTQVTTIEDHIFYR